MLWGVKNAELWLELNNHVMHYLSVAMKMLPDGSHVPASSAAAAAPDAGEKHDEDGKVKSPNRKKRRFQAKKSPKRKRAKKTDREQEDVHDENEEGNSESQQGQE